MSCYSAHSTQKTSNHTAHLSEGKNEVRPPPPLCALLSVATAAAPTAGNSRWRGRHTKVRRRPGVDPGVAARAEGSKGGMYFLQPAFEGSTRNSQRIRRLQQPVEHHLLVCFHGEDSDQNFVCCVCRGWGGIQAPGIHPDKKEPHPWIRITGAARPETQFLLSANIAVMRSGPGAPCVITGASGRVHAACCVTCESCVVLCTPP